MILSILVAALNSRRWMETVSALQGQAERFDGVEVCVVVDGGKLTSGTKRNMLTDMARGDYVAFFDDDDTPAENYVELLRDGCLHGRDVVTFDLEMTRPGYSPARQSFGLGYADKQNCGKYHGMTANHLCAWRKDIAARVRWDDRLGYGDDQLWYKPLTGAKTALAEYHIDAVLYNYRYHPDTTANQRSERVLFARQKYFGEIPVYIDHAGEIYISTCGGSSAGSQVRDRNNNILSKPDNIATVFSVRLA